MLGGTGYRYGYPSLDDLRLFMNEYHSNGASATLTAVQIIGGGYYPSNQGDEANLNIKHTEPYPTLHIFYTIGGDSSA